MSEAKVKMKVFGQRLLENAVPQDLDKITQTNEMVARVVDRIRMSA